MACLICVSYDASDVDVRTKDPQEATELQELQELHNSGLDLQLKLLLLLEKHGKVTEERSWGQYSLCTDGETSEC